MLFPHRLALRSSLFLAAMLFLLHCAALGCLLPLSLPVPIKLALAAAVLISLVFSARQHAFHTAPSSVRALTLKNDGTVEGVRTDGLRFEAGISGQTALLSWLIVILLKLPQARRHRAVVILPDTLSTEDGRVLRAWLRWKAGQTAE